MISTETKDIIAALFGLGLKYSEILEYLAHEFAVVISYRHLKRILRGAGLFRKKYFSDILDVCIFVQQELQGSGQSFGYRWLHLRAIQAGFVVSQDTIRQLLKLLDPHGVSLRSRRILHRRLYHNVGPNMTWHIDGYDKLKPFGICIHGCIDGYSRKIIWLEAYNTNNDPQIVAGYFKNAINVLQGCPARVRADDGTENCIVRDMQRYARRNHDDAYSGENSFMYGKSTANQRIESWWRQLKSHGAAYWIDLFKTIQDDGNFCGDKLDKSLIQFCFLNMIQV